MTYAVSIKYHSLSHKAYSHDFTAAILVFQSNGTAAIHTYIHTLLARPHGAFQSQFTLQNYKTKVIYKTKVNKIN